MTPDTKPEFETAAHPHEYFGFEGLTQGFPAASRGAVVVEEPLA